MKTLVPFAMAILGTASIVVAQTIGAAGLDAGDGTIGGQGHRHLSRDISGGGAKPATPESITTLDQIRELPPVPPSAYTAEYRKPVEVKFVNERQDRSSTNPR